MRRVLFGFLLTLSLQASQVFTASRVYEKGNALYRPLNVTPISGYGHAGVYLNSKSNYQASQAQFASESIPDILNSDNGHCVIHSPGTSPVGIVPFNTFSPSNLAYWGAYDYPSGLQADRRQKVVIEAGKQIGKPYAFRKDWKGPNGFRCDGLVAHAYAQAGAPIPEIDGGNWHKNSPRTQRQQLVLANANAPSCSAATISPSGGNFSISMTASDGSNGSGVDRVEFYNGQPGSGNLIATDDHDSDPEAGPSASNIYTVNSTLVVSSMLWAF